MVYAWPAVLFHILHSVCSDDSKRIPSHTEILLTSVQAMHVDMKETQMENVALHFPIMKRTKCIRNSKDLHFFADANIRCMREDVHAKFCSTHYRGDWVHTDIYTYIYYDYVLRFWLY